MRTITKTYNIYKFDELSEEAKEKAISDQIEFEVENYDVNINDNFKDSIEKAEKLQTPWFLGSIIYEDHKDDIIDIIKIYDYGFFEDRDLIGLDFYPDDWD